MKNLKKLKSSQLDSMKGLKKLNFTELDPSEMKQVQGGGLIGDALGFVVNVVDHLVPGVGH